MITNIKKTNQTRKRKDVGNVFKFDGTVDELQEDSAMILLR